MLDRRITRWTLVSKMLLKKYKKQSNMTNEEKALEKDYLMYCEFFSKQTDKELNKRFNEWFYHS